MSSNEKEIEVLEEEPKKDDLENHPIYLYELLALIFIMGVPVLFISFSSKIEVISSMIGWLLLFSLILGTFFLIRASVVAENLKKKYPDQETPTTSGLSTLLWVVLVLALLSCAVLGSLFDLFKHLE